MKSFVSFRVASFAVVMLSAFVSNVSWAQTAADDDAARPSLHLQPLGERTTQSEVPQGGDGRDEIPRMGLVESPYGLRRGAMFAGLTGTATSSRSSNDAEGGLRIGGSPWSGLTLHGLLGRDAAGRFSPVLTGHFRLLGGVAEGFALGALAQYKAEGFSELGGEAEVGVTGGLRRGRFSMMGNLVAGIGVEEEEAGELDAEAKLRVGYDVVDAFRIGVEGQVRRRLAGENQLAGNRTWDALGGAQLMWLGGPVAIAMSVGPSTVGVASGVGAYSSLTVAAVTN